MKTDVIVLHFLNEPIKRVVCRETDMEYKLLWRDPEETKKYLSSIDEVSEVPSAKMIVFKWYGRRTSLGNRIFDFKGID